MGPSHERILDGMPKSLGTPSPSTPLRTGCAEDGGSEEAGSRSTPRMGRDERLLGIPSHAASFYSGVAGFEPTHGPSTPLRLAALSQRRSGQAASKSAAYSPKC
jgi:hypothetical protein